MDWIIAFGEGGNLVEKEDLIHKVIDFATNQLRYADACLRSLIRSGLKIILFILSDKFC